MRPYADDFLFFLQGLAPDISGQEKEKMINEFKRKDRQFLVYVRLKVNDAGKKEGGPGLQLTQMREIELKDAVWADMLGKGGRVPYPEIHLIEGLVLVEGKL